MFNYLKYFPDNTWNQALNIDNKIVEITIQGTRKSPDELYLHLAQQIISEVDAYLLKAQNQLNTWNLAQNCTPQISSFYFGDYGYGNGKDMTGGFTVSFSDSDQHTMHTVKFDMRNLPIAYEMWFA